MLNLVTFHSTGGLPTAHPGLSDFSDTSHSHTSRTLESELLVVGETFSKVKLVESSNMSSLGPRGCQAVAGNGGVDRAWKRGASSGGGSSQR